MCDKDPLKKVISLVVDVLLVTTAATKKINFGFRSRPIHTFPESVFDKILFHFSLITLLLIGKFAHVRHRVFSSSFRLHVKRNE